VPPALNAAIRFLLARPAYASLTAGEEIAAAHLRGAEDRERRVMKGIVTQIAQG
jgi:hypothetical protein